MIKAKAAPSAEQIKGFERRINNLLDEKQTIGIDVAEIYTEAKHVGVNTTALRKVIAKRRAKTPDPDVVAAMEAYEFALDAAASMVSNGSTSLRKAAADTGFSKSAIHRRASHRNENASSGTPHDPATGEITETAARSENATPGESAGTTAITIGPGSALATNSCCWGDGEAHSSWCKGEGCGPEAGPDELAALIPAGLIPQPASAPPQREGDSTDEDRCLSGRDAPSDEQEAQAAYFCRECENTGRIVYDDGQKIHGSEECLACRRDPTTEGFAAGNQAHEGEGDERSRTAAAGNAGDDRNAPVNLRVSEADGRATRAHGAGPGGGEGVQRRAGCGTAGRAGQVVRDPRASLQCDVGERGDHAPAGRDTADLATPSLGAVGSDSDRVAAPESDGLEIPAFLRRTVSA